MSLEIVFSSVRICTSGTRECLRRIHIRMFCRLVALHQIALGCASVPAPDYVADHWFSVRYHMLTNGKT